MIIQRRALFVDGYDVNRLGFGLSSVQGAWSAPEIRNEAVVIPGRAGIYSVGDPIVGARTISVTGVLELDTVAALRTAEQKLEALLATGTHTIRFLDRVDVEFVCRTDSLVIGPVQPGELVARQSRVDIQFTCMETFGRDTYPIYLNLNTTPTSIPLGPFPSTPVLRVMNADDIVATVRSISGAVVAQIGTSQNLVTNEDYVKFDCNNFRVRLFDLGIESNIISLLTGNFFALDPLWGDYENSSWPTIELSAGSGEIEYRRSW